MNIRAAITERFHVEVVAWAAVTTVAWAISAHYRLFDLVVALSREHERWQIDEAIPLILIISITSFAASLIQSRQHVKRRREAEQEAFFAARRDALTDLPNRRMFKELAGSALGEAWSKGHSCAVLFIDLDGFKPVNDTYGHAVGDALLIAVADLMRGYAPRSAMPARLGGDEFSLLLPAIQDKNAAVKTAEAIQEALRQPINAEGYRVCVGATIGIAIGPQHGRRVDDLIHAADLAMYEAKRLGRGSIRVFEPKSLSEATENACPPRCSSTQGERSFHYSATAT